MRFLTADTSTAADPSSKEVVPRLIALGLPRCATSSLQAALESSVLDCSPCHHMARVAPWSSRLAACGRAMRLRLPENGATKGGGAGHVDPHREERLKILKGLFDGHAATCDFPGMIFADDLMDLYPDALIVLNQRSGGGKAWANSINNTLRFFSSNFYLATCYLWSTDRGHYEVQHLAQQLWRARYGGVQIWDPESYDLHNAWVRKEAEKRGRKVLEWKAEDSWAPLCKLLGKEEPVGKPFPHLNDTADIAFLKKVLLTRGAVSWLLLGGGLWAGWAYGVNGWVGEQVADGVKQLLAMF